MRELDPDVPLVFSWDNPKIHGSVEGGDWVGKGVTTQNHTMLPEFSPDMHNVIETSHAIICRAIQTFINEHKPTPEDTLDLYGEKLVALFHEMLTPEWAEATVKRLFAVTLPAILEKEGDYPPKSCR